MRLRASLLLLCLAATAPLCAQPLQSDWESIRAAAEAANAVPQRGTGVFFDGSQWLHLAPDGRYTAQHQAMCSLGGPMPIDVGQYRIKNDELQLLPAQLRVETDYDLIEGEAVPQTRLQLPEGDSLASVEPQARLLLVRLSDGLRLLDAEQLTEVANMINYNGKLPRWLIYERHVKRNENAEGDDEPKERGALSALDRAQLPLALRQLLREGPVEAQVAELLNVDTLRWKDHQAKLQVKLDRGSLHGLYVGMELASAAPERYNGELTAVEADSAVLSIELSRFHPKEAPTLPYAGQVFALQRDSGAGCGGAPGFAVGGKILALQATPLAGLTWDNDGYAFIEAEIDVGAQQGLIVGDDMDPLDGYQVEGRVIAVQSQRATVMLRLHRYDADDEVELPELGDELGTAAYRAARWETLFGDDED